MASNYHKKERCFKGSPEEYIRLRAKKHRKQYQDQDQARILEDLAEEVEQLRQGNTELVEALESCRDMLAEYCTGACILEEEDGFCEDCEYMMAHNKADAALAKHGGE